jgi:steroid delta-isomerase-like uncharacterized protein
LREAWNSHDGKQVANLFRSDGARHHMGMDDASPYVGQTPIAELAQAILDAWPDSVLDVRSTIEGPDGLVVVEWRWRGTHQKDWGILPARGEATDLSGVSVYQLEGDLIREEHVYWDNAVLMAGAGLLDGLN